MRARLACALIAPALAAAGLVRPPPPDHPLIGTWLLPVSAACAETWEFRADGTAHVLSALEVTEHDYAVQAQPDPRGVYEVLDTIKSSNHKTDCQGKKTPEGEEVRLWYAPLRGGYLLCFDEALERCVGPMVRLPAATRP